MNMGSLIYSIMISEVIDMEVKICWHLEKFQIKKTLKFHLELIFNNFQGKKN